MGQKYLHEILMDFMFILVHHNGSNAGLTHEKENNENEGYT